MKLPELPERAREERKVLRLRGKKREDAKDQNYLKRENTVLNKTKGEYRRMKGREESHLGKGKCKGGKGSNKNEGKEERVSKGGYLP